MASALGCSVREAQQRIDAAEFAEWIAYDRIEPISPRELQWMVAQLTALFATVYRNPKKRKRHFDPEDFLRGDVERRVRRQSAVQMEAIFKTFAMIHNANEAQKKN